METRTPKRITFRGGTCFANMPQQVRIYRGRNLFNESIREHAINDGNRGWIAFRWCNLTPPTS